MYAAPEGSALGIWVKIFACLALKKIVRFSARHYLHNLIGCRKLMQNDKISNILILGAGTMGLQIGLLSATSGFDVIIYDAFDRALEDAGVRLQKLAKKLVNNGRIERENADAGLLRIKFSSDPETAGREADLISESIPEDPVLKQQVFSQFNKICPEHTIFTTNSSTLLPSMIADTTGRPDRFVALHFHDCLITNIVDVMPHPETSTKTLATSSTPC